MENIVQAEAYAAGDFVAVGNIVAAFALVGKA